MRYLLTLVTLLWTAPAFAAAPWHFFGTTNEMIVAPWPIRSTNYLIYLSGFTNRNDGNGGWFEGVTNSAVTVDYTNSFPVTNAPGARILRSSNPVGTNAPSLLKVASLNPGEVVFAGTGGLLSGADELSWNNTYKSLGVGISAQQNAKLATSGAITATGVVGYDLSLNSSVTASADDEVLVGVDINSAFDAAGHSGVVNWALRDSTGAGMYLGTGPVRLPGLDASRVLLIDANGDIASMGAPAADGYILSSTIAGVKSWVANAAGSSGGNPTASVGLTAVNGAASTFLRSDGAPALDQSIDPTWTGIHKFTNVTDTTTIQLVKTNSTHVPLSFKQASLAVNLFQIGLAGRMYWANGTDAADTFLYRAGAGHLKTDGDLTVYNLTPSQPVFTDANSKLVSVNPVPYANLPIKHLSSQYTQVGNIGAGEDTLMTYTLPGGTMAANGDRLTITAGGQFASGANNKTLKFYLGTSSITFINALPLDGKGWALAAEIYYSGATQNSATFNFSYAAASIEATQSKIFTQAGAANDTFASNMVIKFTGEGTDSNDITQGTMSVTYHKAP